MRLAGCYERAWYGRHSGGSGGGGGYIRRAAEISAMADMADILVEIRKVCPTLSGGSISAEGGVGGGVNFKVLEDSDDPPPPLSGE